MITNAAQAADLILEVLSEEGPKKKSDLCIPRHPKLRFNTALRDRALATLSKADLVVVESKGAGHVVSLKTIDTTPPEPKKPVKQDYVDHLGHSFSTSGEGAFTMPDGLYMLKVVNGVVTFFPMSPAADNRTDYLTEELDRERNLRIDLEQKLKQATEKWDTLQSLLGGEKLV